MPELDPPTYADLVAALRSAPPREAIADERYWRWYTSVAALLNRLPQ